MRIHDVSVSICATTPIFPGDPKIQFEQWAALDKGDPANVTMLHFGAHTGTHVDAPAHFIEGGSDVHAMQLESLVGPARVILIADDVPAITSDHIDASSLDGVTRVLFKTRNSQFWKNSEKGFRNDFTYLDPTAAAKLVELGVRLVGIDYLSVEKFGSTSFPTHTILLERGIVILEGLDLCDVNPGDYELICLPLKLAGGSGDGAPVRAILRSLE
jgi:arylformamidase